MLCAACVYVCAAKAMGRVAIVGMGARGFRIVGSRLYLGDSSSSSSGSSSTEAVCRRGDIISVDGNSTSIYRLATRAAAAAVSCFGRLHDDVLPLLRLMRAQQQQSSQYGIKGPSVLVALSLPYSSYAAAAAAAAATATAASLSNDGDNWIFKRVIM